MYQALGSLSYFVVFDRAHYCEKKSRGGELGFRRHTSGRGFGFCVQGLVFRAQGLGRVEFLVF